MKNFSPSAKMLAAIWGNDFPPPVGMFKTTCLPLKINLMASSCNIDALVLQSELCTNRRFSPCLMWPQSIRIRPSLSPQRFQLCSDSILHCTLKSFCKICFYIALLALFQERFWQTIGKSCKEHSLGTSQKSISNGRSKCRRKWWWLQRTPTGHFSISHGRSDRAE